MPVKRPPLVNNEIYHIVVRGVGDTSIFNDNNDYYRGIFSIYEFNNVKPITIREQRKKRKAIKANRELFSDTRDPLVEIWSFYFMPNHIHLLIKQIKEKGITKFMRKMGAGYAAYFNKKYNRKGHLFQGRFQAVHIKSDEQLRAVFVYIHTNGTALIEPGWKEKGVENPEKVIEFLENYKWSSYPDYIGKKNFPSVIKKDFLLEIMGGEEGCRDSVNNWINHKKGIKEWGKIILE